MATRGLEPVLSWFRSLDLTKDYETELRSEALDWTALQLLVRGLTKTDLPQGLALLKSDLHIKPLGDRLKVLDALSSLDSPKPKPVLMKVSPVNDAAVSSVVNPLQRKPFEAGHSRRQDGFQTGHLVPREDNLNPLYINPAIDTTDDSAAELRRKPSLAPPRWSLLPNDNSNKDEASVFDAKEKDIGHVVFQTLLSWRQHIKLVLFVISCGAIHVLFMWLHLGGYGSIHGFLANIFTCILMPILFAGLFVMASHGDYLPYAFYKTKTLAVSALTTVLLFLRLVAPPYPDPIICASWVHNYATFAWGFTLTAWPAYLLYAFRGAFVWKANRRFLRFAAGFGVAMLSLGIHWDIAFPHVRILPDLQAYATLCMVCIGFFWLRTSIYDTLLGFQQNLPIRGAGEYLMVLFFMVMWFPWMCTGVMGNLQVLFGNSESGKIGLIMVWSCFLAAVYLNCRLLGLRCLPYTTIPIALLPLQLVGDLFTELVFLDFSVASWQFWLVLTFDVMLLIMRDADLYDDVAIYVKKNAGRLGVLLLRIGELFVGPDISTMAHIPTGTRAQQRRFDRWQNPPTDLERSRVKRELCENCVVSEMLASAMLFTVIATESALDALGVPGCGLTGCGAGKLNHAQRMNALAAYAFIMGFQIIGIFISHQIIAVKNAIAAKLRVIQAAGPLKDMELATGCSWHFFLSHVQSTAGDQVYSLHLELEKRGYKCWYDNQAKDLTTGGMKEGVQKSVVFVLFLSKGVMSREFVQLELREAVRLKKKILLIHETDERFNAVNFADERHQAPDDLEFIFDDIESVPWRRRNFERTSMLDELMLRSGPSYSAHFRQREQQLKRQKAAVQERRVSTITANAMWFNKLFYFRLALAVQTGITSLVSAGWVSCIARGNSWSFCVLGGVGDVNEGENATIAQVVNGTVGVNASQGWCSV